MNRVNRTSKVLRTLTLTLCLLGLGAVYAQKGISFQGMLSSEMMETIPSQVEVEVEVMEAQTETVVYCERHRPAVSLQGIFSFFIGSGEVVQGDFVSLKWDEGAWTVRVKIRPMGQIEWMEGGMARLHPVPYAVAVENADEHVLIADRYFQIESMDKTPLLRLTEEGWLGAHTATPVLQGQVGANKQLRFSSNDPLGDYKGLISFHWTILGSKPAIVGYDETMRQRFAVVAHYWSVSSNRAHQHISFEVDTESSTAINTQFGFPWGVETADVQTFSNIVTINAPGSLQVKESIKGIPADFLANVFQQGALRVGSSDDTPEGNALVVASDNDSVALYVNQTADSYSARLQLSNGHSDWYMTLPRAKELQLAYGSSENPFLRILPSGWVAIGNATPSQALEVRGGVTAQSIASDAGGFAYYINTNKGLKVGDLVGLEGASGMKRRYEPGDLLMGVVVENGFSSYQQSGNIYLMSRLGVMAINPTQYVVDQGVVRTPDGQKIGLLLSGGEVYVNLRNQE